MDLPVFDTTELDRVLEQDLRALDAVAANRVKEHLARLGQDGEAWVADGMERIPDAADSDTAPV